MIARVLRVKGQMIAQRQQHSTKQSVHMLLILLNSAGIISILICSQRYD